MYRAKWFPLKHSPMSLDRGNVQTLRYEELTTSHNMPSVVRHGFLLQGIRKSRNSWHAPFLWHLGTDTTINSAWPHFVDSIFSSIDFTTFDSAPVLPGGIASWPELLADPPPSSNFSLKRCVGVAVLERDSDLCQVSVLSLLGSTQLGEDCITESEP